MTYNIGRNYDTDLSRSDVRTLLANIAKETNTGVPTKTVFETPEIVSEDDNHFAVPVRPTVTAAGFDAGELVRNANVRDVSVVLVGVEETEDGGQIARVKVSAGTDSRCADLDTLAELHA
jgi:hypothetical protein